MKSQELLAGHTYAGVPAREIVEKSNRKVALRKRRAQQTEKITGTLRTQTEVEVVNVVTVEEEHTSSDSESDGTDSSGTLSYPSCSISSSSGNSSPESDDDANEDSNYSPLSGAFEMFAAKDWPRDQMEKNDQNLKFSAPTFRPLI